MILTTINWVQMTPFEVVWIFFFLYNWSIYSGSSWGCSDLLSFYSSTLFLLLWCSMIFLAHCFEHRVKIRIIIFINHGSWRFCPLAIRSVLQMMFHTNKVRFEPWEVLFECTVSEGNAFKFLHLIAHVENLSHCWRSLALDEGFNGNAVRGLKPLTIFILWAWGYLLWGSEAAK